MIRISLKSFIFITLMAMIVACGEASKKINIEGTQNGWRNKDPVLYSQNLGEKTIFNKMTIFLHQSFHVITLPIFLNRDGTLSLSSLDIDSVRCSGEPVIEMNLISVVGDEIKNKQFLSVGGTIDFRLSKDAVYGIQFLIDNDSTCREIEIQYNLVFTNLID